MKTQQIELCSMCNTQTDDPVSVFDGSERYTLCPCCSIGEREWIADHPTILGEPDFTYGLTTNAARTEALAKMQVESQASFENSMQTNADDALSLT